MPPVAATIDEDFKEDFHKKKKEFFIGKIQLKNHYRLFSQ